MTDQNNQISRKSIKEYSNKFAEASGNTQVVTFQLIFLIDIRTPTFSLFPLFALLIELNFNTK